MGMSIYFPWNTLTTVTSYWNFKLRNVSNDSNLSNDTQDENTLSDLQKIYNSYLSIASMVPNAIILILHALLGHKIRIQLRLYGAQVILKFDIIYLNSTFYMKNYYEFGYTMLRLKYLQVFIIGSLILITILSCVNSDNWQKLFLDVNLITIAFYNIFIAVFKGK